MKPKVYVTVPIESEIEEYIAAYCDIHKWAGEDPIPRNELLKKLSDVEGLFTAGVRIDEDLLKHAPHLKVVSNVTVGYNNFDLQAMKKQGVIGTNTPHVLNESMADLTFGLMLSVARRINELDKFVKAGKWEPTKGDETFLGLDVYGTTLGIIGMGRIGEVVARRAKLGFNMDVLYHNRKQKHDIEEGLGIQYADMESLLIKSDFIVLLTPLTDETYHLIGENEFKKMKNTAVFINVSRGQTVDEQALIKALQNNEIYGAGLDVFTKEPVEKDNPLLQLKNVVTVPHIGTATAKTRRAMSMRAAENLVAVLTGKQAIDRVSS